MGRLTFKEPDGKWGIVGMNEDNQDEKVYGCLCKLLNYEETGLSPDDISSMKYKINDIESELQAIRQEAETILKRIYVGQEIQGYIITVISHNYCLAERINKVDCDDFVVWSVDNDRKGVNTGRYFSSWNSALQKFISLIAYERGIYLD